jgi:hypothetical protein
MRRKTRTRKAHWRVRHNSKDEAEDDNWSCPQESLQTRSEN